VANPADVVTGETIASEWGNQIRDQTVQPFASVAARTASIPSPTEGMVSYLLDADALDVYTGSAWVPFVASNELDGATDATSVALTTSPADAATVSLTIPAGWGSWKCAAYATGTYSGTGVNLSHNIRIDGTDGPVLGINTTVAANGPFAIAWRRTGMTTTGSRSIVLRASESGANASYTNVHLYARAVRTS